MVDLLYAVASFTCALIAIILPIRISSKLKNGNKVERSFYILIRWTALFCLADGMWGIAASEILMNDTILFIMSIIFHTSAALTPAFWLSFVTTYLGTEKRKKFYQIITALIILIELVLIAINAFNKMMFYVDADGIYCSTPARKLLFYLQYSTYVIIGIISVVHLLRERADEEEKSEEHDYSAVLLFVAAPILCGVFQMLYPDAPAYSIGYILGVSVIYSFILTSMIQKTAVESAKAEAASEAKTSFLFSMSHDIRTPMNAIMGFTNIAKKNMDNKEKLQDSLDKIQKSGSLLLSLINSILDMSRIESGKATLNETAADVRASFTDLESTLAELAKSKDIELSFKIADIKNPFVYVDCDRANRIFMNIISNSIKYGKEGGYVKACCEQLGEAENGYGRYKYTFEDNGIGMSPEFVKHVFEEFSREENSTISGIQGTGLGLSVCKAFTELLGGTIECESQQGVGTCFTVILPFRVREGSDEDEQREYPEIRAGKDLITNKKTVDLSGKRALLVEDNELNREIATDILNCQGIEVECAENGAVSVQMLKEKGKKYYDFILMDIQMPVMNGYEATAEIRKLYPDLRAPIIALSANAFAEDKESSAKAGMDGHVAKPIDTKELFGILAGFMK